MSDSGVKNSVSESTDSTSDQNGSKPTQDQTMYDDSNLPAKQLDDDGKGSNFDSNFATELDQIETDLSALSNNFKKRRLSKNEMDFLESELNMDMDNITDADFDIHLQKLISENASNIHPTTGNENRKDEEARSEGKNETEANIKETTKETVSVPVVAESTSAEPVKDVTAPTTEIESVKEPTSISSPAGKSSNNNEGGDKQSTDNISAEQSHPEPVKESKEDLTILKTTTSTTIPHSNTYIPPNSELFRDSEANSALSAYRALLNDSNNVRMKEANHINAQLSALPLPMTAPDHLSFNVQMLVNTLPVLDNLATQILRIIAKGPYQKVMELVSNRESYTGIAFSNLVELFETTKRIYNSEESPFFTVENITFGLWKFGQPAPLFLKGREDTIEGTLRKVNLSTFVLATLGLIDLGFFFLNEAFLDVFCPPQSMDPVESLSFIKNRHLSEDMKRAHNDVRTQSAITKIQRNQTKFLKAQAILYLELKTQAYISAIELGDKSKEDIIYDLFPDNMDEILLKRKDPYYEPSDRKIERNSTLFTPAEIDFLNRCDFRRQTLLKSGTDSSLMEKYEWIKFLNDLLEYVSKNVGFLIWGPKGKVGSELEKLENLEEGSIKLEKAQLKKIVTTLGANNDSEATDKKRKYRQLQSENDYSSTPSDAGSSAEKAVTTETHETDLGNPKEDKNDGEEDETLDSSAKGKRKKAKQNRPSTFRRIWTSEEEDALREGLKQKGTHWTAILELYGPGGQVNESLKNRSSLQLKDKARNWKMFYIKNNLPVPEYLQKATGEEKIKKLTSRLNLGKNSQTPLSRPTMTGKNGDGTRGNGFADADVYDKMLEELLPNAGVGASDDKSSATHGEKEHALADGDEVVASELKDLVAEAFK